MVKNEIATYLVVLIPLVGSRIIPRSSGQEWLLTSNVYTNTLLTSSGQEWQFHIPTTSDI